MTSDLGERFQEAIQSFWAARARQQKKQVDGGRLDAGRRGAATGGSQMGSLEALIADILIGAGLQETHVRIRTGLELPGYYRPEKKWDLLVVSGDRLVLAIEFKSLIGPSFGNNFNNRVEEAIGNSDDVFTAYREGRFGRWPPPFLGFLFLLEDCAAVHRPVRASQPYFKIDPIFQGAQYDERGHGASYAKRSEILCERLIFERKYNATCLVLATDGDPPKITFPLPVLDFNRFAGAIEAHARTFASTA